MKHKMTVEEKRVLIQKYMDDYGFNLEEAKEFYNESCEGMT